MLLLLNRIANGTQWEGHIFGLCASTPVDEQTGRKMSRSPRPVKTPDYSPSRPRTKVGVTARDYKEQVGWVKRRGVEPRDDPRGVCQGQSAWVNVGPRSRSEECDSRVTQRFLGGTLANLRIHVYTDRMNTFSATKAGIFSRNGNGAYTGARFLRTYLWRLSRRRRLMGRNSPRAGAFLRRKLSV